MIWLASFPRSGNTFFRNILYEVYGLESSTFHKDSDYFLDDNYDAYPVVKTHLLPNELLPSDPNIPGVYIIRDGRDALCSIAHHRKDIVAPGSDYFENLKAAVLAEKGTFFGGWSENVNRWVERAAIVIRYEDLLTDPIGQAERLRAIMDLPQPNPEKLPSFKEMKFGLPKYGSGRDRALSEDEKKELSRKNFRKGKAGGWKEEMPEDMHTLFWSLHGETMEGLGYHFDGSMRKPDPDLDYLLIEKLGLEAEPAPERKYRILMEADKVVLPDNDGVKRYQVDLLKGLARITENPNSRWEIDLYIKNNIYPLAEYKEKIFNPFKNADLKSGKSEGRKAPKKSLIERFEQAMVSLVPKRFAAWLHKKNIRIFHNIYIFVKKLVLGTFNFFIRLAGYIFGQLNVLYSNIRQMFIVPKEEKEFRSYDLIHLPLKQHFFPFRKTKTPLLTTVHDLTHRYFAHYHTPVNISNAERGLKFIQKSGSHVLAVSQSTLDDTLKEIKINKDKVHLVHEATDKRKFHFEVNRDDTARIKEKYNIPADTAYFLCLSTLEPRKNIANTVKAFNALVNEHPDYPLALVIAGKKGWLQQTALQDQIYNDRIVYTGFIDDDDLSGIYSEALALCYLSFYEGFGLPALEAMSCGTPVLYGNNSSLPEVVGKGGLPADPHNVEEIKDKMKRLFEDKELLNELRQEALKQSLNFSWRKTLMGTLQVYEKVINFGQNSGSDNLLEK